MRILFLDDNAERIYKFLNHVSFDQEVIVVRDAETAIDVIAHCNPEVVFLDHDLGGEEMVTPDAYGNTGMAVVFFLREHGDCTSVKRIFCHSLNPGARKEMVTILKEVKTWQVWDAPFTSWNWKGLNKAWTL